MTIPFWFHVQRDVIPSTPKVRKCKKVLLVHLNLVCQIFSKCFEGKSRSRRHQKCTIKRLDCFVKDEGNEVELGSKEEAIVNR
jgi:hypothetical protein